MKETKYKPSDKIWSIKMDREGWYYEIRLKGCIIDRLSIPKDTLGYLRE